MKKRVTHRGEVRKVERGVVQVAIVASGACHACRARELCGMGESQEKLIDVTLTDSSYFSIGDVVEVAEEQQMALRAVLVAYVGALVVLLAVLLGALLAGVAEGFAALMALVGVALYYGGVYLLRHRIETKIHFTITKS